MGVLAAGGRLQPAVRRLLDRIEYRLTLASLRLFDRVGDPEASLRWRLVARLARQRRDEVPRSES